MKLPPLTAIHYFTYAAKHLSLSTAAKELHVTEGAVSRLLWQSVVSKKWPGCFFDSK